MQWSHPPRHWGYPLPTHWCLPPRPHLVGPTPTPFCPCTRTPLRGWCRPRGRGCQGSRASAPALRGSTQLPAQGARTQQVQGQAQAPVQSCAPALATEASLPASPVYPRRTQLFPRLPLTPQQPPHGGPPRCRPPAPSSKASLKRSLDKPKVLKASPRGSRAAPRRYRASPRGCRWSRRRPGEVRG